MNNIFHEKRIFIVMFAYGKIKKNEFVPAGEENLVHKAIFIGISPERDERVEGFIA